MKPHLIIALLVIALCVGLLVGREYPAPAPLVAVDCACACRGQVEFGNERVV